MSRGIFRLAPILLLTTTPFIAAPDCGSGVTVYEDAALDGYTLLGDEGTNTATLLDMKGNTIREWSLINYPVKLLPGGHIMGSRGFNPVIVGDCPDTLSLLELDWDGNVVWTFSDWDNQGSGPLMARQHHDLEREGSPTGYYAPGATPLEGGRTLVLAHENVLNPEISDKELLDDVLYELDAGGMLTGFEWHASDHFQEMGFDEEAKATLYADPVYDQVQRAGDWLHTNAVSYLGRNHWYLETGDERFNPNNMIICTRNANFLAIISRETGRIVWSVGPDFSEGSPGFALGQLQGPHHAHMIPAGLPGAGNILVYDNGGPSGYGPNGYPEFQSRGYSRVLEFNPVTLEVVWEYGSGEGAEQFYSGYISSAQRLPNGNTLIDVGSAGRVLEVTPDQRIVWEYSLKGGSFYRAYRIPPEWLPEGVNPAAYPSWSSQFEPAGD